MFRLDYIAGGGIMRFGMRHYLFGAAFALAAPTAAHGYDGKDASNDIDLAWQAYRCSVFADQTRDLYMGDRPRANDFLNAGFEAAKRAFEWRRASAEPDAPIGSVRVVLVENGPTAEFDSGRLYVWATNDARYKMEERRYGYEQSKSAAGERDGDFDWVKWNGELANQFYAELLCQFVPISTR